MTCKEQILQQLKTALPYELSQNAIYSRLAGAGFDNPNTVRGRLSELVNADIIVRREGGWGTYYKVLAE